MACSTAISLFHNFLCADISITATSYGTLILSVFLVAILVGAADRVIERLAEPVGHPFRALGETASDLSITLLNLVRRDRVSALLSVFYKKQSKIPSRAAQHEVLRLPELLSLILAHISHDGRALAACMRVNRLWWEETTRIAWAECGDSFGQDFEGSEHRRPTISHVMMLVQELERLQLYARHVRSLCVKNAEGFRRAHVFLPPIHLVLLAIKFPRVTNMTIFVRPYNTSVERIARQNDLEHQVQRLRRHIHESEWQLYETWRRWVLTPLFTPVRHALQRLTSNGSDLVRR